MKKPPAGGFNPSSGLLACLASYLPLLGMVV
jgi:hypothetical protein